MVSDTAGRRYLIPKNKASIIHRLSAYWERRYAWVNRYLIHRLWAPSETIFDAQCILFVHATMILLPKCCICAHVRISSLSAISETIYERGLTHRIVHFERKYYSSNQLSSLRPLRDDICDPLPTKPLAYSSSEHAQSTDLMSVSRESAHRAQISRLTYLRAPIWEGIGCDWHQISALRYLREAIWEGMRLLWHQICSLSYLREHLWEGSRSRLYQISSLSMLRDAICEGYCS